MSVITNEISFDLMKPADAPVIHAVQGDRNTRSVKLSLFCDGEPWQVPEGTLLAIRYGRVTQTGGYYDTLPDGTCAWEYEDNSITIVLAPQMMSSAGVVDTQVEMIMGDQMLATFSFKLMVEVNPAAGISTPETYINWLQWMKDQLDAYFQSIQENDAFTGPAGPEGDPAEVTEVDVTYQAGDSGTIIPTDSWSSTIPAVPEGQYLWTKTTIVFNDTTPVTFYTAARMGIDGAGSVASVCGVSPDENGNIALDAAAVGALSVAGGTMQGPINMNGQTLSGLNAPTEDTEAATRGYTLGLVKKAAPRNLLDNSDFTHFVAQAGIGGSHGTQAYAGDRWMLDSGEVTGEDEANGSGYTNITLNGTIRQIVADPPEVGSVFVETVSGTAEVTYADGEVTITSEGGVIKNVALYEGEYTADNLPVYQPKGYCAELMECMRYFFRFDYDNTSIYLPCISGCKIISGFLFHVPMRVSPTMTIEEMKLWTSSGITDISSSVSLKTCSTGGLRVMQLSSAPSASGVINLTANFSADL